MKPHLLLTLSLCGSIACAQPPPVVVEETVVETLPAGRVVTEVVETQEPVMPGGHRMDPELTRRQLRIIPRTLDAPPPGTVVETTETTTTIERPGIPPRVYNTERNVVIVEGRELPYVTLPVLFIKQTAELLDSESRAALEDTAAAIREIVANEPGALFDIEGHTSTEGTDDFNMNLSAQRARRVYDELTRRYQVPAENLSAHGHGENYPRYPNGTEAQLMLDRRVLVVRVK